MSQHHPPPLRTHAAAISLRTGFLARLMLLVRRALDGSGPVHRPLPAPLPVHDHGGQGRAASVTATCNVTNREHEEKVQNSKLPSPRCQRGNVENISWREQSFLVRVCLCAQMSLTLFIHLNHHTFLELWTYFGASARAPVGAGSVVDCRGCRGIASSRGPPLSWGVAENPHGPAPDPRAFSCFGNGATQALSVGSSTITNSLQPDHALVRVVDAVASRQFWGTRMLDRGRTALRRTTPRRWPHEFSLGGRP